MKTEILTKLEKLLETDNIFSVQREFKELSAQFRNLIEHGISDSNESEDDHEDDRDDDDSQEVNPAKENQTIQDTSAGEKSQSSSESKETGINQTELPEEKVEEQPVDSEGADASAHTSEPASSQSDVSEKPEKTNESNVETPANAELLTDKSPEESSATTPEVSSETESPEVPTESDSSEGNQNDSAAVSTEAIIDPETSNDSQKETAENISQTESEKSSSDDEHASAAWEGDESEDFNAAKSHFEAISEKFKNRLEKAKEEKKKLEEDTLSTARDLLDELQKLVENEENIGKAFTGFNAIRDRWKSLPRVSNDAYRDLNIEYNKFAEQFFYNINIYKELKELDLKHNLEQKMIVIEDQKKLLELNDIRRMEVEVRLNQDRWNEIGPTFKEEWNVIKDEFWVITKAIYKKILDFYNARREQQERNFEQKQELLNKLNEILALDIRTNKVWQSKTSIVIDLQKQWKMVGYVPKEKGKIWKDFRSGCDKFFENKRLFLKEISDVQDANKEAKQKLLEIAQSIKDSEDFNETSRQLINLQAEWKKIGAASQRDENKLYRKFRQICNSFFQKRNEHRHSELAEQKVNLTAKHALLEEMEKFEPGSNPGENVKTLKEFAEKWRAIGHVPYKEKDAINKTYKKLLDAKFGTLKIDKKQKEKIRFEQKLEDIRDRDNNDFLIRKEQENIRAKISKLKNEVIQFENNMGFFASSKGANKLKEEVGQKVNKLEDEISTLKERLALLREA